MKLCHVQNTNFVFDVKSFRKPYMYKTKKPFLLTKYILFKKTNAGYVEPLSQIE